MGMKRTYKNADKAFFNTLQNFARDRKGVAAIEFALIIPVMIGMYFMLNETANGMRASRKVTMVARILADLSSRPANLSDADRNDIFSAASPVMAPFGVANGGFRITSIRFDATGKGFVDWSEVSGAVYAPYARCTPSDSVLPAVTIPIPAGLKVPNTSLILAEAHAKFKPVIGVNITGTIDLVDSLYMRPRVSDFVTRNGVTNPACV